MSDEIKNPQDDKKDDMLSDNQGDGRGSTLDSTGKASKARVKTGSALIPKTSFQPIAAPEKLNAMKYTAEELKLRMRLVFEDLLRIFVASKVPVTLWGPAGSGKTRTVEALAKEQDEAGTGYNVITVQPSTEDPQTIHGMMTIKEDPRYNSIIMERSIPAPAQQTWQAFNNDDALTIMFLDEMTTCSVSQQNALLGMLTHGKYGNLDIHPYTTFVMAANPENTVSTVNPLGEAILNRGAHLPWYSDVDHFLSKWRTGFGDKKNSPSSKTNEFLTKLLWSEPDITFRCDPEGREEEDMWHVDDLVPYEDMATSERVSVAMADTYHIISEKLRDVPYDVRVLYLEEAIKALVGPRYAAHAVEVEYEIESHAGTEPSLNAASNNKITSDMATEEIIEMVGDSLHRNHGKLMIESEEKDLAEQFEREIFEDGDFFAKRYMAFWLWLATSPSSSTRQSAISVAVRILQRAGSKENKWRISKNDVLPGFVPGDIRQEMKEILPKQRIKN